MYEDWTKLTDEQRLAFMEWRKRVVDMIRGDVVAFERDHSAIMIDWRFSTDPQLRTGEDEK